jgi:hypothetical protein
MVLKGKDALALHARAREEDARKRRERLAAARAEADARGKEPFDLAALERLVDTSSEGRVAPAEARHDRFEYMYYVENPGLMTIAELARLVQELNAW